MPFTSARAALAALLLISASPALAEVTAYKVGSGEVKVDDEQNDDYMRRAWVEGTDVEVKDAYVSFKQVGKTDGVDWFLGEASGGGNACDSSPFLIAFEGGKPKLFGPVDSCRSVRYSEGRDGEVVLTSAGNGGDVVDRWTWSPKKGLVEDKTVVPVDPTFGWATVGSRKVDHPGTLLSSAEITSYIERLIGRDFADYRTIQGGPGEMKRKGAILSGSACRPHNCINEQFLTVVSPAGHAVFVAYKPVGERIRVWPAVGEWPKDARGELKEWASTWK